MATILRRYTDVLSLLDILRHNRLTLLSPSRWYDQNDALGLKQYSARKGRGEAFALCLAEGKEQAHHWQIFAGHSHGLCIQFDRDEFIAFFRTKSNFPILHGPVVYCNLTQIREMNAIETDVLPFLKRDTFEAEKEYRVVAWDDDLFDERSYTIRMPAKMIKKVTLGPTMPDTLADTLREIACKLNGCADIPFAHSRLVNNAAWARAIAEGLSGDRKLI